ncbi:MAG: hypothetical protein QOG80_3519 [Pseudonocardiales bacterium]|nr:hypothetical protein [Pseudonocardiales bacterium]
MRRLWAGILVGVLVVAALVTVVVARNSGNKVEGTGTLVAAVTIPGSDGTPLSAYVIPPKGGTTATHAPLVIMPASWASGSKEYLKAGQVLAASGYEVISYAQRGFRPSQGQVGFADAKTQADVSSVIDWALEHTGADKSHIGAVGISYGAGVALLAAERDPRIKAVVGMTAWADLGASLDPNHTLNKIAVSGLMTSGAGAGTLDQELSGIRAQLSLGFTSSAESMLNNPVRSPATGVDALNRNKTAVLLANGYQDSLIIPNQLVTFFDALTGPKRLELRVGDHGGPENSGLAGKANEVWQSATRWLDHYLRGVDNGVQQDDPVQLKDVTTNQWHSYKDWSATSTPSTLWLGEAAGTPPTGSLGLPAGSTGQHPAWTRRITSGVDTVANSGTVQINNTRFVVPSSVSIASVTRANAVVWTGPPTTQATLINGEPRLHVTVAPSAGSATFYAYLYDVDPVTGGALVTYAPYSLVGARPGEAQTVDVDLGAISWTVPQGHHLALVIDTVDARYAGRNPVGSTVTFSSTPADPSDLAIPIG